MSEIENKTSPRQGKRSLDTKWVRRGVGILILLTAAMVVVPALLNQQSGNAIINSPLFSVQAPISGTVQDFNLTAGQAVTPEQRLGRISNLRAREMLHQELMGLEERLGGLRAQEAQWQRLQRDLQKRSRLHANHEQARLEQQLAELQAQAKAQQAQVRQDQETLARQERLVQENFISPFQYEAARNTLEANQARLDAIHAREKALRIERQAVLEKIYLGEGRNDVPYTQQKSEDLSIQLAELRTRLRETESRVAQIKTQLQEGTESQQALQEAPVVSPVQGLLWRKFFANGSEVIAGGELAQVIHCRDAFVDAAVSESQLHNLRPGTLVQYRLLGTTRWLEGKVRATSGSANNNPDPSLAAQLLRERREGRVLVDIRQEDLPQAQANLCYAGRMVDVKIPRSWNPLAMFSRLTAFSGT